MQRESKQKRIGLAIFKVILEKALESIPVYGTVVVTGYKVFDAIRQLREKDKERELTKREILDAVGTLTYSETQEEVDRALSSPKGIQATRELNSNQRANVRRQLIQLPSELDQILEDIKADERREAEEVAVREAQAAARKREEEEKEFLRLKDILKKQLKDKEFQAAHQTVEQMLAINPNDREAKKVEAFIYKRIAEPGAGGCFVAWVLAGVIMIAGGVLYGRKGMESDEFNLTMIGAVLAMCIIVFLGVKVWPYIPRRLRKVLGFIFIVITIIYFIAVAFMK